MPSLTAPPHKRDLLVTRWCLPSLSVVDMRPGAAHAAEPATTSYRFGPTRFSVIPKAAQGKVSVRFVPNQDADTLVEKLRCSGATGGGSEGGSLRPNTWWLRPMLCARADSCAL